MKCISQASNGTPCDANAINGDKHCYFHSPKVSEEARRSAQSRGGRANEIRIKNPLPAIQISKVGDVVKLLEETVNLVRAGELDVKVANCIGVLSGHLLKALEVDTIANRVEIIERAILERRTRIS